MASEPIEGSVSQKALLDKVLTLNCRRSVKTWFLRYGVVKGRDGTIFRYPNMKLYTVQRKMFEYYDECLAQKKPCHELVLKWRKGGASTAAQAMNHHRGRLYGNRSGAILGDVSGTSDTLFEILRTFSENDQCDWGDGLGSLKPGDKEHNLTDDIELPNRSTFKKVTAGSTNANRSGTIQIANASEAAYYVDGERDPLTSFLGSWTENSEASLGIIDSTSSGASGKYYDYFMDPRNSWKKIFCAWFEDEENQIPFAHATDEVKFRREMDAREHELMDRFSLTLQQMNWLRAKLVDKCGGSVEQLNKEYPSSVEEAFMAKSALRFSITVLESMERIAKRQAPQVGELIVQSAGGVSFQPDPMGTVKIYEEPKYGAKYIGAFDPCAGKGQQSRDPNADPDYHSIGILRDEYLDPRNGQWFPPMLVAHHHSRIEAEVACETAAALSQWYGGCQFVVETNGVGLYPVKRLAELKVPLWRRQSRAGNGATEAQDGWQSNEQLRKTVLDTLGALLIKWKPEEPTLDLWDIEIIGELKTMIIKDGKAQAMTGRHDDTVLMLCLAIYNRTCATLMQEPRRKPTDIRKLMQREGWKLVGR